MLFMSTQEEAPMGSAGLTPKCASLELQSDSAVSQTKADTRGQIS